MASYNIRWKNSAAREIRKLPAEAVLRILAAVDSLSFDPFPPEARKMAAVESTFRIRVGDYRIIYRILNDILVIEIVRIGHRRDVYRKP